MPRPVDHLLIAELLARHGAALALYARQWTVDADDCVQEALIELAGQRTAPDNPTAWLYRVVRNRALNAARGKRRRSEREQAVAERRRASTGPTPADAVEIEELLARLPCVDREIVVLRVWGQLSWQEIAELVGSSKSSVHRDYAAALARLREMGEPKPCPKK